MPVSSLAQRDGRGCDLVPFFKELCLLGELSAQAEKENRRCEIRSSSLQEGKSGKKRWSSEKGGGPGEGLTRF